MAGETVSEAMKKLESLHGSERNAYYHSLPKETKEAIAEIWHEQYRESQRVLEITMARARELEYQGIVQFEFISDAYERAAQGVVAQMESPELRKTEGDRMFNKRYKFLRAVYSAPAPPMIELWKKYEDRARAEWGAYRKVAPDAQALQKIEKGLMESIIRDARKLAEAEPERDRSWYMREKWQPLLRGKDRVDPQK